MKMLYIHLCETGRCQKPESRLHISALHQDSSEKRWEMTGFPVPLCRL